VQSENYSVCSCRSQVLLNLAEIRHEHNITLHTNEYVVSTANLGLNVVLFSVHGLPLSKVVYTQCSFTSIMKWF